MGAESDIRSYADFTAPCGSISIFSTSIGYALKINPESGSLSPNSLPQPQFEHYYCPLGFPQ